MLLSGVYRYSEPALKVPEPLWSLDQGERPEYPPEVWDYLLHLEDCQ